MKVRKALAKDFGFIVQSQMDMAWESEQMKLDSDTLIKGVQAVLNDSNKGQYWIVEKEEEPIGMCLTIPEWSDWRNGTVVWIHSVYTLPKWRMHGVYKTLYTFLRGLVEIDATLRGIRLYVDKNNINAQKVYQALGMNSEHYELYEWMCKK